MMRLLGLAILIALLLAGGLLGARVLIDGPEVPALLGEADETPLAAQPPVAAARSDVTVVAAVPRRPAPGLLRQSTAAPAATWPITPPGCCPGVRWAADSARVLFYHRPADGPAGLWSADAAGAMTFLQPNFGHVSADGSILVSRAGGSTLIEGLDGRPGRTLENRGVETLPSPDGRHVAYLARLGLLNRDDPQHRVTVAAVDGGEPTGLLDLARADWLRWLPDGRRLVVFGWRPEGVDPGLWTIDIATGAVSQIVQANFLTAVEVSPDSAWIAYLATLQPNPADNGLWIVRPDGSERRQIGLGRAARWSADSQALLILAPAPGGKEIHRLDIATGAQTVLVGRADADFDVEADDWSLAPDGRTIVYRSPRDRALWLLQLNP